MSDEQKDKDRVNRLGGMPDYYEIEELIVKARDAGDYLTLAKIAIQLRDRLDLETLQADSLRSFRHIYD